MPAVMTSTGTSCVAINGQQTGQAVSTNVIVSTQASNGTNRNNFNASTQQQMTSSTTKQLIAGHHIPSDILDDLGSRFIINVPDDERNNLIRICFQIELAHWFYLDFFCSIEEKKLVPCGIKPFATLIFQHIPFLRTHLPAMDKILEDWKQYKLSVPTYGAILMSEDLNHVLLVQSYWAKSSWGFPKGKVNEHEDPIHCATREVFEETGYDITGLIVPSEYIESVINYQYTRLYLVRNVPLQTQFMPRTRKEIKCCEWFPIDSLPTNKNDAVTKANLGRNANSFFMIMPFIKRLKKWAYDNRAGIETPKQNNTVAVSSIKKSDTKLPTVINTLTINNTVNNNNTFNINSASNSQKFFKRQRHKSMGDIDGISLNCNGVSKSSSGTKYYGIPLSNSPYFNNNNNSNVGLTNDFIANVNQYQNNTNHLYHTQNQWNNTSLNNSFNRREKNFQAKFKRQLFNSNNSNSSCPSTNSLLDKNNCLNFDITKQNNSIDAIKPIKCNLIVTDRNAKQCNRNNNNRTNRQPSGSNSISNNSINKASTGKHQPLSTSTPTQCKKSPTFDSWTNFSFTKNFIANVFC